MAKDPAFLFYSKDFYEGTRMMLPEERACYIDLMIYQHQNGIIPNDIKRVLMYCNGIDEATLKATLKAKFKQIDKGWYNEVLKRVCDDRKEYALKQSSNGKVGQIMKKAKAALKPNEYRQFKDYFYNVIGKEIVLNNIENNKTTLKATLKASLKHYANGNAIVNEDVNEDKEENKIEIIYPFDSEDFLSNWKLWKQYKKEEHNFKYKSKLTEQAALKKLSNLTSSEDVAIKILMQSMENGYKGFFELNNKLNGNSNNQSSKEYAIEYARRKAEQRAASLRPN